MDLRELVREYSEQGFSIRDTANALHCGRGFVSYWRKKHVDPTFHAGLLVFDAIKQL